MTKNKKFKRRVRARARFSSETYSQARRVLEGRSKEKSYTIEVVSPFNSGWYFYDSEYPEEGSVGPYPSYEVAEFQARECGYDTTDEEAVSFFEQKEPSTVLQRYVADGLHSVFFQECIKNEHSRMALQRALTQRLSDFFFRREWDGLTTPPEEHVKIEISKHSERDQQQRVARVNIKLLRPELYPDFVRELQDFGLLFGLRDSAYLIAVE